MPFLDVNLEHGGGIVFVLAGSSGSTIAEFKDRIRARPKGTDVLSRVPETNGWEIAPMDAGDRILVALSQMLNAASELDRSIAGVEKLALHYLAAAPHLANARQLREFAVRAVERGSARSDRIRYDDLFDSGDPDNKSYWASVMPAGRSAREQLRPHPRGPGRPGRPVGQPAGPARAAARAPSHPCDALLRPRVRARRAARAPRARRCPPRHAHRARWHGQDAARAAGGGRARRTASRTASSSSRSRHSATRARFTPAVAEAVGLGADADLAAWLGSRRALLLVLDNLEHLRGVDAVVAELLVGDTVVLATSRGPLRLSAEHELPVEPLAREAAVELFVSRAEAIGRRVAADETVGEICRRVDDLPLALELAAARVRLLSPTALLQRLDESLSLLTSGARDLPERQRTLRATIEWSHDLLAADEQAVFRRLSVFRGSFTLEAAEAVAGADLDQVATLVEQSLLKPLGDDRLFFLETLREYARERLDGSGERDEYALRHAHWYLERLEKDYPETYGPRHGELMAWFVAEEDNLRAMLTVLSAASPSQAARAARTLQVYWTARGAYGEARERLTRLLGIADVPARSRAELFGHLTVVEFLVGDIQAAEAAARESLRLTDPGDEFRAHALLQLATIAGFRGEHEEAIRLAGDALAEIDAVEERDRPGFRLNVGNVFAAAGLREEARTTYMQVSDEARRLGDPLLIALADGNAFGVDLVERRYDAAEAGFRTVIEVVGRLGHASFEAGFLRWRGFALLGLSRRSEARAAFMSSLEVLAADTSPNFELAATVDGIALASEPADLRSAARIAGAIAAVRKNARLTDPPWELELRRRFAQPLIDALGADEWVREQAAGATLTLEKAIELARMLAAPARETTKSG